MQTTEIASALLGHVVADTTLDGVDALYAADAVSVEAFDMDGQGRETHGAAAIKGKHEWWGANFTVHSASHDGPYFHGEDRFAVIYRMDAEENATGQRWEMQEIGVYHVSEGKIVREEFFNVPMPMG